ncbi:glycosyltransferase involved in cell wall biosynthesis [Paenibacillus phyllosphaerae]|uniref:Glycosyltransferase involved in cell wall biosynthesis n=1 Tax=Paenibacillus phyllosphaerae TaxID=274593 RepID=A0A7W5FMS8_9BACL|nr:glycosyltransferase [Paenibacillus phyllosphaerae]MBB3110560.1 glycosyltransferase involved in cell wall biosynthesis [Paenibacillus phyllosphaerae]
MNIIVFNVPAEHGGALSILNDFYKEVCSYSDSNIKWIFVLSKPQFEETENVKVIRFPWIKKSWIHRSLFDYVVAPYLVRKNKAHKIFSLQNLTIPFTNVPQTVYVHQPLPFIEHQFSFSENKLFWLYQKVIGRKIIKSIKHANKVIVQTKWMKKACMEQSEESRVKFDVIPPKISMHAASVFKPSDHAQSTFFYPASAIMYKNHRLIVEACKLLDRALLNEIKIIFTLNKDESDYCASLYKEVEELQLPIDFVGHLTRDEVYDQYTKSVLLFPSYIETYGLPLKEAKTLKGMIAASDCAFSREILDDYPNATFFNPFDANSLAIVMEDIVKRNIKYVKVEASHDKDFEINQLVTAVINS